MAPVTVGFCSHDRSAPKPAAWPNEQTRSCLLEFEQVFAKVKHWLRMAQARSIDAIHEYVARLVGAIHPAECANYFHNAGYVSS